MTRQPFERWERDGWVAATVSNHSLIAGSSVCLHCICLSDCQSDCPSVIWRLSDCLTVYLSVYLSVYFVYLDLVYVCLVYTCVYLSVWLYNYLSVWLSVYMLVYLQVCQSVYLSVLQRQSIPRKTLVCAKPISDGPGMFCIQPWQMEKGRSNPLSSLWPTWSVYSGSPGRIYITIWHLGG